MIDTAIRRKLQLLSAWCGVLYVLGLLIGWALVAGFLPPHRPSDTADTITAIFQTDYMRIRIGMVIVMFTALIVVPFAALISQVLARLEGSAGILAYSALLGGAGTMVLTIYPAVWWLVAAFRIDRSAELIYLMNDMSWLQFIGGVSLFYALPGGIMIAAFFDKSAKPVFPRWSGYFNLWVMLLILPDQLLYFFHSGPFAWNGIISFWIPLFAFGGWFLVMAYLLRKAIVNESMTH